MSTTRVFSFLGFKDAQKAVIKLASTHSSAINQATDLINGTCAYLTPLPQNTTCDDQQMVAEVNHTCAAQETFNITASVCDASLNTSSFVNSISNYTLDCLNYGLEQSYMSLSDLECSDSWIFLGVISGVALASFLTFTGLALSARCKEDALSEGSPLLEDEEPRRGCCPR